MPDLILAPIASKTCTKCGKEKPVADYHAKKRGMYGVSAVCKQCISIRDSIYRSCNPGKNAENCRAWSKANPERKAELNKSWTSANRETHSVKKKEYYEATKEKFRDQRLAYLRKNKELRYAARRDWYVKNKTEVARKNHELQKKRMATDPVYALRKRISSLISVKIRAAGYTKKSRTHEILGCDWDFFKAHIEKQFHKGMAWENRSEWQIDHIQPLATAKTEEDVIALNHFTNLRPMWAKDNREKSAKITHLI